MMMRTLETGEGWVRPRTHRRLKGTLLTGECCFKLSTLGRSKDQRRRKLSSRGGVCQESSKYLGQLFVADRIALHSVGRDLTGSMSGAEGRASINACVVCLR